MQSHAMAINQCSIPQLLMPALFVRIMRYVCRKSIKNNVCVVNCYHWCCANEMYTFCTGLWDLDESVVKMFSNMYVATVYGECIDWSDKLNSS